MAANDLHTSCRTVVFGVSFFGVMVRPGGRDILGVGEDGEDGEDGEEREQTVV